MSWYVSSQSETVLACKHVRTCRVPLPSSAGQTPIGCAVETDSQIATRFGLPFPRASGQLNLQSGLLLRLNFYKIASAFLLGLLVLGRSALAVDWKPGEGFRYAELPVPKSGKTGFTKLPAEATGIYFTNRLALDRSLTNQIYLNGSGVAAGDFDGDGWCDLFFCGLDGPNVLYRNLGNWKFQDVTESAGVTCPGLDATGAAFADIDGDGDLDLIVSSVAGGTHVFFNDGKGRFTESVRTGVLNERRAGMSLALADIDGDGDLDLYIANYRTVTLRDQPNTRFTFRVVNGQPVVTAIDGRPLTDPDLTNRFTFSVSLGEASGTFAHEENGEPDVLYRNDGGGHFTPVSFTDGSFLRSEERRVG